LAVPFLGNIVVGYFLVCRVGDFTLRNTADAIALGGGCLVMAVLLSRQFGRFNGGNAPGLS
jgi:hypothetical protein